MSRRIVAINELGIRIGEDHQRAKLTDAEVDLMRQLNEEGMSYSVLAEKFEVGKTTVAEICRYEKRAQIATKWRVIKRK